MAKHTNWPNFTKRQFSYTGIFSIKAITSYFIGLTKYKVQKQSAKYMISKHYLTNYFAFLSDFSSKKLTVIHKNTSHLVGTKLQVHYRPATVFDVSA